MNSESLHYFHPDAAIVVPRDPYDRLHVTWKLGSKTQLVTNLSRNTIAAIENLGPQFFHADYLAALDNHPDATSLLELLYERGILSAPSSAECRIRIFLSQEVEIAQWELPASTHSCIDIFFGYERNLVDQFDEFARRTRAGDLVGWIMIDGLELIVGPIRYGDEAAAPIARGIESKRWLARRAEDEFRSVSEIVKKFLSDCLVTSRWFPLSSRGYRIDLRWREASNPFRVTSKPIRAPKIIPRLAYWASRIQDGPSCSGVSDDQNNAEFASICEAYERFALSRPDLFRGMSSAAKSCDSLKGTLFNYYKKLTIDPAGYCLAQSMEHPDNSYSLPCAWVFLLGSNSVANTNGAAFGRDTADALRAATFEVIERNNFMHCWFGLAQANELFDELDLPEEIAWLSKLLRSHNLQVHWYQLGRSERYQAIVCALGGKTVPNLTVGAAARSSLEAAAKKALYEAIAMRIFWLRKIESLGRAAFVARGRDLNNELHDSMGLEEMGWVWATRDNALDQLAERLQQSEKELPESALLGCGDLFVDLALPGVRGSIVKVLRPESLPLPSCMGHLRELAKMVHANAAVDALPLI